MPYGWKKRKEEEIRRQGHGFPKVKANAPAR
jgi:hypothetical protein